MRVFPHKVCLVVVFLCLGFACTTKKGSGDNNSNTNGGDNGGPTTGNEAHLKRVEQLKKRAEDDKWDKKASASYVEMLISGSKDGLAAAYEKSVNLDNYVRRAIAADMKGKVGAFKSGFESLKKDNFKVLSGLVEDWGLNLDVSKLRLVRFDTLGEVKLKLKEAKSSADIVAKWEALLDAGTELFAEVETEEVKGPIGKLQMFMFLADAYSSSLGGLDSCKSSEKLLSEDLSRYGGYLEAMYPEYLHASVEIPLTADDSMFKERFKKSLEDIGGLSDKKIIALPQGTGAHWMTWIIDIENKIIEYFDSKAGGIVAKKINGISNQVRSESIKKILEKQFEGIWTVKEVDTILNKDPMDYRVLQQDDNYLCGSYISYYAEARASGLSRVDIEKLFMKYSHAEWFKALTVYRQRMRIIVYRTLGLLDDAKLEDIAKPNPMIPFESHILDYLLETKKP